MDYKDKLGEAQKLFDQAKGILESPNADSEEKAKVQTLMEAARELKQEALQLKEILDEGSLIAAESKTATKVDGPADPGEFKDWADFLQAVHGVSRGRRDPRLHEFQDEAIPGQKKDMSEGVGASGGFLVPAQFLAQLYAAQAESAIVRARASVIRMTRRQVNIPVLDQTGTTAGVPHWFGGMQFYWTEEGTEKTSTDPEFRQLQLVAHKMIGYTRASDELVDDSAISLADFLSGPVGFAGGVTWMEDYAFIQGSGAGQPLGVINAGATLTVNRASVASPVQYSDLVDMYESFLPTGKGVWLLSQSVISNLLTVQDAAGNYLWLPNMQNIAGGVPPTLFGFPIVFTEKCPRVGTAGDVILADWKYYVIGDRQATTIESTKFDRWRYDQTSWRVVHRVDGRPWLSAPLTYQDGTTQTSPFVILGAKST
jgi:HK97 family phage major capsid protein